MAGLVPAIHDFWCWVVFEGVDARDEPRHDDLMGSPQAAFTPPSVSRYQATMAET